MNFFVVLFGIATVVLFFMWQNPRRTQKKERIPTREEILIKTAWHIYIQAEFLAEAEMQRITKSVNPYEFRKPIDKNYWQRVQSTETNNIEEIKLVFDLFIAFFSQAAFSIGFWLFCKNGDKSLSSSSNAKGWDKKVMKLVADMWLEDISKFDDIDLEVFVRDPKEKDICLEAFNNRTGKRNHRLPTTTNLLTVVCWLFDRRVAEYISIRRQRIATLMNGKETLLPDLAIRIYQHWSGKDANDPEWIKFIEVENSLNEFDRNLTDFLQEHTAVLEMLNDY